jgi:hypothetical protein
MAYAHRQRSAALRAKAKQPGAAKQPYARSAPSAPPPLAPPAKAPVEKGCQAVVEVCYLIYLGYFV